MCLELLDLSVRGVFDLEHPLTGKDLGGRIRFVVFLPGPFFNWCIDLIVCGRQELHLVRECHGLFPSVGVRIRVGFGLANAQVIKELGTVCMVPLVSASL